MFLEVTSLDKPSGFMRSPRHLLFCLCFIVIVFLYGEFNKVSSFKVSSFNYLDMQVQVATIVVSLRRLVI